MASTVYQCIICQQLNNSVLDLHHHHVVYHTLEQLSLTIINLQGIKTMKKSQTLRDKASNYLKSNCTITLNDGNNNENLLTSTTVKINKKSNNKYKNSKVCDAKVYEVKEQCGHDAANCLINCSQFIPWEQELNKRVEIDDDVFSNSIDKLCNDLKKGKRRGRKRKNFVPESTDVSGSVQVKEDKKVTDMKDEVVEKNESCASQTSVGTTSDDSYILNSVSDTSNGNKVLDIQINKKMSTKDENRVPLTLIKIDAKRNVLTYNPTNGSFSWSSFSALHSDLTKMVSSKETDESVELKHTDENNVDRSSVFESSTQALATVSMQGSKTELIKNNENILI